MAYLHLEHINSTLGNNALFMEHRNWERWVLSKLQGSKLSSLFESLYNSVAAATGIMNPEPPTRAVVKHEEHGQVVEVRSHSKTPRSRLMKKKGAVFAVSPFCLRDSGPIYIRVSRVRDLISMTP